MNSQGTRAVLLEIFKKIAERAESNQFWDTEINLNDPVTVFKKFRGLIKESDTESP